MLTIRSVKKLVEIGFSEKKMEKMNKNNSNILNLLDNQIEAIKERFNNERLNEEDAELAKLLFDVIEIFRKEQTLLYLFPSATNDCLRLIDREALRDVLTKHCQEIVIGKMRSKLNLWKGWLLTYIPVRTTIEILFNSYDLNDVVILDLPLLRKSPSRIKKEQHAINLENN